MHLYFSAIVAIARSTGKPQILQHVVNLGAGHDNLDDIHRAHQQALSSEPGGIAIREEYSRLLVIVDNQPGGCYNFPGLDDGAASKAREERRSQQALARDTAEKEIAAQEVRVAKMRGKLGARPAADPTTLSPSVPTVATANSNEAASVETGGASQPSEPPVVGNRQPDAAPTIASVATAVAEKAAKSKR